jgi:hypothetical protein
MIHRLVSASAVQTVFESLIYAAIGKTILIIEILPETPFTGDQRPFWAALQDVGPCRSMATRGGRTAIAIGIRRKATR